MKRNLLQKIILCSLLLSLILSESKAQGVQFSITFPKEKSKKAIDGRLLLFLATHDEQEPRFLVSDEPNSQLGFGIDVENLTPNQAAVIDAKAFGYPIRSLKDIPEGEYYVQALLHRYETFKKADGHTVKLPMDRGEGQNLRVAPGNLYSTPQKIKITPKTNQTIQIVLDQENPPMPAPKESKYIKYVKMRSKLLSDFWGRDMYLGAFVLLPEGFDKNPQAKYPLCVFHGHFPAQFEGFREIPPDPDLELDYSERFKVSGYNKIVQEEAHNFYKWWTAPETPRFLVIEIQHANPFYDDSYAVNSANIGPYGDAITYELIPFIEKQYRGIGEGWARFLYGGSTGGWEALAAQVLYPDEYNGCFAACPDPIDFRAYTVVDIYKDKNAYYQDSQFKTTPRPGKRDYLGHVYCTLEEANHHELMLGTKSRSGAQWDIWEAVYSPVGEDGYPKPIWDKLTGKIDTTVAAYWRENYDLNYIMQRDWSKIGKKLEGKIHIYCGDMDNFYLNNAVYLAEDFLESTTEPYYAGEIDYGDRAEHCWNGDQTEPNHISRLRYNTMYVDKILQRIEQSAPKGADLKSWRH